MKTAGFHLMAKPVGPVCNLQCGYCFYLEKNCLFQKGEEFLMSDKVLEAYIFKYINSQNVPEISFVWQGGEPMLAGIPFYEKVIELQKKYANGKHILNSIQTNGTLLDEEWCAFFKRHQFLVGISMDGPASIHNQYRVDRHGEGTFKKVLQGIKLLQKYEIEFNVLVCVSRESCKYGTQIYNFLKNINVKHIQFTPLIERLADKDAIEWGFHYAMPDSKQIQVTEFSVIPKEYGDFMIEIFDNWMKEDVGTVFIHNIETVLPIWMGLPSTMCIHTQECGGCMIVEHNGDIYSCDHFMYPQYKIGNILTDDPWELVCSKKQVEFGQIKNKKLSIKCQMCEVKVICGGGCPKHRFITYGSDVVPTHYLCEAYEKFYRHINPYMRTIVKLIQNGRPASEVMDIARGTVLLLK